MTQENKDEIPTAQERLGMTYLIKYEVATAQERLAMTQRIIKD